MTNGTAAGGDRHLVTGLFIDDVAAERAYQLCVDRGYQVGDINIVMSEDTRRRLVAVESEIAGSMAARKAAGGELGGPAGGRAAMLITVFAAVGTALALPALGLVMTGPIAAALMGAGAAGVAASLVGALGDWGLPEDRVRQYEAGIGEGGILIGVEPRSKGDARLIDRAWKALGGRHVHS
jgi:hypothetical protein